MFDPNPRDAKFEDDTYLVHVLIRQLAHFGPVPKSYADIVSMQDMETWGILATANEWIKDNHRARPFDLIQDDCLTEEDRKFLLKIMKFDPRDRPTAKELLRDEWFEGVP